MSTITAESLVDVATVVHGRYVLDSSTGRARARTVAMTRDKAIKAVLRAHQCGTVRVFATHGGSVANSYGYSATTEALVYLASPDGRVACWRHTLLANGVTLKGVAGRVGLADLFDERVKAPARIQAAQDRAATMLDAAAKDGKLYAVVDMTSVRPALEAIKHDNPTADALALHAAAGDAVAQNALADYLAEV